MLVHSLHSVGCPPSYTTRGMAAFVGRTLSFISIAYQAIQRWRMQLHLGRSGGERAQLQRAIDSWLPVLPIPYPGNNYRPVAVTDLATFIVSQIGVAQKGRGFNVFGDITANFWSLTQSLGGRKRCLKMHSLPPGVLRFMPALVTDRPVFNQLFSIDRTTTDDTPGWTNVSLPGAGHTSSPVANSHSA